ncbi:hypothetical protein Golax_003118 [Gossypium laxum]|uniref:Uncharacterized protein n=1 Tax=Gossypium laxum TaxID=34288 RepID=A0A7J9AED0_9ROSI|nr:hypothetical protein [Gossypium laxum]
MEQILVQPSILQIQLLHLSKRKYLLSGLKTKKIAQRQYRM